MRGTDWALEQLATGAAEEGFWRAEFIGLGGIGPIRMVFPPDTISLFENVNKKLFRRPCCTLQVVSVLQFRAESLEERTKAALLRWEAIQVLLGIPLPAARDIVRATDMAFGHDQMLRSEILDALGLPFRHHETLSWAP